MVGVESRGHGEVKLMKKEGSVRGDEAMCFACADALVDLTSWLGLVLSRKPPRAFSFSSCISDTQPSLFWPPMRLASLQR